MKPDEGNTNMDRDGRKTDSGGRGNSFANGPQDHPLRDWQLMLVRESQETFWRHI